MRGMADTVVDVLADEVLENVLLRHAHTLTTANVRTLTMRSCSGTHPREMSIARLHFASCRVLDRAV